ncbi:hypothetical protein [Reichenbachiella ulvae]|uniref:Vitamin uptake transporter n=1 Tax=Reichenbachiella ulvae TaxID=2980104 RepID=A0ABT3CW73_9BACT|nr:hypothetical protein [Reichenbachiella ulvae]MCV9387854.1 hypothetical protein [Reichenbachiella ulvae]
MSKTNLSTLYPLILGVLATAVYDSLGVIVSENWEFDYSLLKWGSYLIWVLVGGFTFYRTQSWFKPPLFGAAVGFFDSTVGWLISIKMHANVAISDFEMTWEILFYTITYLTFKSAFYALLGAVLTWLVIFKADKKYLQRID